MKIDRRNVHSVGITGRCAKRMVSNNTQSFVVVGGSGKHKAVTQN